MFLFLFVLFFFVSVLVVYFERETVVLQYEIKQRTLGVGVRKVQGARLCLRGINHSLLSSLLACGETKGLRVR